MKIIVGLGNPGSEYIMNRHNIGFITIDKLAHKLEQKGTEVHWKEDSKHQAITAKVGDYLLVKPTTYMNRSGQAIQSILSFYKEPVKNMVVVYDEVDLPIGKIRVRAKGSAGTHNGVKSIIESLGTENFSRIRIGIESRGEIAPQHMDLKSFVLSDFTEKEVQIVDQAIDEAILEIEKFIESA